LEKLSKFEGKFLVHRLFQVYLFLFFGLYFEVRRE
jgi:hypothetical protein